MPPWFILNKKKNTKHKIQKERRLLYWKSHKKGFINFLHSHSNTTRFWIWFESFCNFFFYFRDLFFPFVSKAWIILFEFFFLVVNFVFFTKQSNKNELKKLNLHSGETFFFILLYFCYKLFLLFWFVFFMSLNELTIPL